MFYRLFWPRNPFKMNTSKKSLQVLILNDLLETSNPLESTLTKKRGRGKWQTKGPEAFVSGPRKFRVMDTRLQLRVEEESQCKGEQRQRLDEYQTENHGRSNTASRSRIPRNAFTGRCCDPALT